MSVDGNNEDSLPRSLIESRCDFLEIDTGGRTLKLRVDQSHAIQEHSCQTDRRLNGVWSKETDEELN